LVLLLLLPRWCGIDEEQRKPTDLLYIRKLIQDCPVLLNRKYYKGFFKKFAQSGISDVTDQWVIGSQQIYLKRP
jgi:hypothetical protein